MRRRKRLWYYISLCAWATKSHHVALPRCAARVTWLRSNYQFSFLYTFYYHGQWQNSFYLNGSDLIMRYSHSLTIWRWKMRLRGRYWLGRRVNLETLGDDMWMAQFRCVDSHEPWNTYFLISLQPLRFTSVQIEESLRVLDLPSIIHCSESHNEDSQTALCMPLVWLAHPSQQCDFEMQFG